jgi:ribosomal protein L25 (general stress protein Ctc)
MNYGLETPLTLRWEGGSAQVVIREVQMNNLKRAPVHVDFYAPRR